VIHMAIEGAGIAVIPTGASSKDELGGRAVYQLLLDRPENLAADVFGQLLGIPRYGLGELVADLAGNIAQSRALLTRRRGGSLQAVAVSAVVSGTADEPAATIC